MIPDSATRGVARHAASDDQVAVAAHPPRSYRRRSCARCIVPRGLARTATTGARRYGDRRGVRRDARRAAPDEQSERRAGRDLLLPVVLEPGEGRRLGALVRRPRGHARPLDGVLPEPRALLVVERQARRRADARDRGRRRRDASSSRGGGSTRRRTSACRRSSRRREKQGLDDRDPCGAVSRPDTGTGRRGHRQASRGARRDGLLRLRRRSRSRRPTGRRRSNRSTASACSGTRRSSVARKASGFDGLYTYDVVTWNGALFRRLCTQAHAAGLLCAPSVGPGYDARLATRLDSVRPRSDGLTYDRMWKTVLRANADLVTVTSYNEWQEGTQIEPARVAVGKAELRGRLGEERRRGAARVPLRDGTLGGAPRADPNVSRARSRAGGGTRPSRDRPGRDRGRSRARARAASRGARAPRPGSPRGGGRALARDRPLRGLRGRRAARRSRAALSTTPSVCGGARSSSTKRRDGDRRPRTDELGDDAAVLERLHGGNPLDAERRREPGVRVDVDLGQLDRAVAGCDLGLEDGRERPARAAPGGPEVDDAPGARASARSRRSRRSPP